MTKKWWIAVGVSLAGVVALAVTNASAGVAGTKHDLSAKGYGTTEVCAACHTPHNAKASPPLWNHGETSATFTLYSSSTLNAVVGQPTGTSKLCLGCHDGTVGVDAIGSAAGTNANKMTGSALVGTDLSNDHPVSFTYDAALATADGGLVTPASASLVVTGLPLFSGKLECATCHDVHGGVAGTKMLNVSNAASALCLKCHVK